MIDKRFSALHLVFITPRKLIAHTLKAQSILLNLSFS